MRSSLRQKAEDILVSLGARLDPSTIDALIDTPVDRVVDEFLAVHAEPKDYQGFCRMMTDFIIEIHQRALRPQERLSDSEAFTRALTLIPIIYRDHRNGYDLALLDALGSEGPGARDVLLQIADALKSQAKSAYVEWVYASELSFLDWPTKRKVAEVVLTAVLANGASGVLVGPTGQFVDGLRRLVEVHLQTGSALRCVAPNLPFHRHG